MIFRHINTLVHIFRRDATHYQGKTTHDLPCRMCTSRANISWAQTKTFSISSPRALCFLSFYTTSPDSRPGPGLSPRPFCGSSHHLLSQTTNQHMTIRQQQCRSHWVHHLTVLWNINSKDNSAWCSQKGHDYVNRIQIYLCTLCTGKNRNILLLQQV